MNQIDKPVVHLRYQQVFFVTGVIKHGNKEKAYSKATPKLSRKAASPRPAGSIITPK